MKRVEEDTLGISTLSVKVISGKGKGTTDAVEANQDRRNDIMKRKEQVILFCGFEVLVERQDMIFCAFIVNNQRVVVVDLIRCGCHSDLTTATK